MSVAMPIFLYPENKKWIEEIESEDCSITYKAKKDAPKEIKDAVRRWNAMFRWAEENHIQL